MTYRNDTELQFMYIIYLKTGELDEAIPHNMFPKNMTLQSCNCFPGIANELQHCQNWGKGHVTHVNDF